MMGEQKVTAQHLQRSAYLYVRQSTVKQVNENTESTQRQYALKQRAVALGWAEAQVIIIDCDLGHSGASTVDRTGFQRLVTEVGMGRAGIVMGLEVSRLARNSADWHRLLEICAFTQTLILDEDGLYDPSQFNDRLLLGLKGTMSEAELHLIRARMRGGVLNKAKRGELRLPLPIGYLYDDEGRVGFDPDQQVQKAIRYFFETFRRTGAATATTYQLRREGVLFPRRGRTRCGEVNWKPLNCATALRLLHNPRYAGAFSWGVTQYGKDVNGKVRIKKLPLDQWPFLTKSVYPAYITWEEFLQNQEKLRSNAQDCALRYKVRPGGAAREGPSLLQGIVLCGRCGKPMRVHYCWRRGQELPIYSCTNASIDQGEQTCQTMPGQPIDEAVAALVVESVTPAALELVLSVQQELETRLQEADQLRHQQVERAQYEADKARLRYLRVDPNNRLVADTLETLWNEKLAELARAQEDYERGRFNDQQKLTEEHRQQILKLAEDFPKLWRDPKTAARERKRMVRLLIEDVTLKRSDAGIGVHIRFKGGALKELHLPKPMRPNEGRKTKPEVIQMIDELLGEHDLNQVAEKLNAAGFRSGCGQPFTRFKVAVLCRKYKLARRAERLRRRGYLGAGEMAKVLGIRSTSLLQNWKKRGLIKSVVNHTKAGFFYQAPTQEIIDEIRKRTKESSLESQSPDVV